jgi:hypothetical protein
MGLDPQESFAEVHEDGGVEDTVGVEVEVLDVVVPQQPLEEVAGRKRQSLDFFGPDSDLVVAETLAVMSPRQIQQPPRETSSSHRRSLGPSMARASFSKCTVSSLAFARELWQWFPVAARSDLRSPQRRQCALVVVSGTIC